MIKAFVVFIFFFSFAFANHEPIVLEEFVLPSDSFPFCHASSIVETEGGLLVGYFAGSKEGENDVAIYLSAYQNGQWLSPEKVASADNVPCWNPVLSKLGKDSFLLFYRAGNSPRCWSSFMMRSDNNGKSWTHPTILPAGVLGPIKNKPLLLEDGVLLCGSSVESYEAWGCWVDITTDEGKSWEKSNPINVKDHPYGIIQPTLFFSNSDTLMMLTRSKHIGMICSATSSDYGKTWTEAKPTSLPNPNSGIDAIRLKDGRILLVYNHSQKKRTPLNVAVSLDGGLNWNNVITLENNQGSYSYPAVIETSDGLVHITYSWNGSNIKHVVIDPSYLK